MGTRGFIGVKVDGKIKGTYNHFDSYPHGLGQEIVNFCKEKLDKDNLEDFKDNCKKVKLIKMGKTPSEKLIKKYQKYSNLSVSSQDLKDWYCLLREVQGVECFVETLKGELEHWIDGVDFLKDSLFCEYAYILNLDEETIEFYEGYNDKPDRKSPLPFKQKKDEDGYYPVKFNGSCGIFDIPDNWIEEYYKEED